MKMKIPKVLRIAAYLSVIGMDALNMDRVIFGGQAGVVSGVLLFVFILLWMIALVFSREDKNAIVLALLLWSGYLVSSLGIYINQLHPLPDAVGLGLIPLVALLNASINGTTYWFENDVLAYGGHVLISFVFVCLCSAFLIMITRKRKQA